MAAIGGVSCFSVHGPIGDLKERSEVFQHPGFDGFGIQLLGQGDSSFSLIAKQIANIATLTAWKLAIEALQGTVVSVTDDTGESYSSLFVEDAKVGAYEVRMNPDTYNPASHAETMEYLATATIRGVVLEAIT